MMNTYSIHFIERELSGEFKIRRKSNGLLISSSPTFVFAVIEPALMRRTVSARPRSMRHDAPMAQPKMLDFNPSLSFEPRVSNGKKSNFKLAVCNSLYDGSILW